MSNTKLSKILWALIPIVIAIISIFVISRYTTSQGFYEPFTDSLDDKRNTVLEMTAASTAASGAISFLPAPKKKKTLKALSFQGFMLYYSQKVSGSR